MLAGEVLWMRRITLTICVAGLVLFGACGDDDERARTVEPPEPAVTEAPDETPEPDEPEEAAPEPKDIDLEAALLTLDDMPSGWTQEPEAETDDESDVTLCDVEPLDDVEAVDSSSREFSAGDFGPFLHHSVAVYESGQAEQALDAFLEALDACDEWTEETEDGPVTWRPRALSFPGLGDDTVAVRINVEAEAFNATVDMVTWRRGDFLSLLFTMEVFGSPDAEQMEELARVADERLADLR
jgi:hypothetical protein